MERAEEGLIKVLVLSSFVTLNEISLYSETTKLFFF